jgi:hypothetical protein
MQGERAVLIILVDVITTQLVGKPSDISNLHLPRLTGGVLCLTQDCFATLTFIAPYLIAIRRTLSRFELPFAIAGDADSCRDIAVCRVLVGFPMHPFAAVVF